MSSTANNTGKCPKSETEPDTEPKSEREAFELLKKTGSLKHLVGIAQPYFPWTGLKFPVEIDLRELVDVMEIVNDEWIRWKMPGSRLNQMNTVKCGIKQMLKEDPTKTKHTFEFKDQIRSFMKYAIFILLGELGFDYAPYTRNEDIMYGMINALTRRNEWPVVCSAATMAVKHHSYDWGKLHPAQNTNLHLQTWMRRECWREWSKNKKNAVYPMRCTIKVYDAVQIVDDSKNDDVMTTTSNNSALKQIRKKKDMKLTNTVQFKKKAKRNQTIKTQCEVPICKYFKKKWFHFPDLFFPLSLSVSVCLSLSLSLLSID